MSNPLRKMFGTVPTLEMDGVVVEYAPGVEVKVARAGGGNKKYSRVLNRLTKPYRRAIESGTLDEEVGENLLRETFAISILTDWTGFTKDLITNNDEDASEALPFNKDNAMAVLKAQPNLFNDIKEVSSRLDAYRVETLESESGN